MHLVIFRNVLLAFIAIFISSCESLPSKSVKFNQKYVRLILVKDESGRRYVDEDESVCFMRRYEWSAERIGSLSEVTDLDISECNDVTGSSILNHAKKLAWLEELRLLFNNR